MAIGTPCRAFTFSPVHPSTVECSLTRYNRPLLRIAVLVTDPKTELERALSAAVGVVVPEHTGMPVVLDRPKQAAHGDYAASIALALARRAQRNPRHLAEALVAALPASKLVERIDIAGAGFINLVLTAAARQAIVTRVLTERDAFGLSRSHLGEPVMVEFVSANPTGPLHVGHGRQAALGDAIGNLLATQGYAVTREFYYNDAGQQIQNLAVSVRARAKELLGEAAAFPEDGYHGEYIREIAQHYLTDVGHDLSDIERSRRFAVAELRREQDRDLMAFGVKFDSYYLESSLYTDGRVERDGGAAHRIGQDVRAGRRVVAAHDGLRRRQGPRDAQVRRRLHVFRARRRLSRHQVGARLHTRDQRAGRRPSQHDHARARRPAGDGDGHSGGLSRLRTAQDGHGDARRRGSEDQQARRRAT